MKKTDPMGSFVNDFEQINMFLCSSGQFFGGFMKLLIACYLIVMGVALASSLITIATIYLLGRLLPFTF
jgi:hypothetical protein